MPLVWKQPSLITFDSFEDVLAHYTRRASAEELRGLLKLETLLHQPPCRTKRPSASQGMVLEDDTNQPRAWRRTRSGS